MMGEFIGGMLYERKNPAIILPIKRRIIEFVSCELFSLMEINGENRGCPIKAKKIMRVL